MEERIFELIDIIDNEIQDSNASMVQATNIGKYIDELKAKLRLVKKLNIDDVNNQRELLGKFYIHLSEQAVIHDTCRNDEEMEEAIRKFNL